MKSVMLPCAQKGMLRHVLRAIVACAMAVAARAEASRFAAIPMAPPDPILGVAAAFKADTAADKVNLGIGAYRDAAGKPLVLRCVREAERKIANDESLNKEYVPIEGLDSFLKVTTGVIFGADCAAVKEGRVAVVQTLSGTGALRVAGEFLNAWHPGKDVYISDPSWGNHHGIFQNCGMQTKKYRYLSPAMALDIDAMLSDLRAADKGSIFILHTVAHNPTGVDPTQDQWRLIAEACKEREAVVIFDTAYQGYASGDLEKDAWAVRYFVNDCGLEVFTTQSYSKNFGLYGERIGALSVVCRDQGMCVCLRAMHACTHAPGPKVSFPRSRHGHESAIPAQGGCPPHVLQPPAARRPSRLDCAVRPSPDLRMGGGAQGHVGPHYRHALGAGPGGCVGMHALRFVDAVWFSDAV